jgi:hypothetical protein
VLAQALEDAQLVTFGGSGAIGDLILCCTGVSEPEQTLKTKVNLLLMHCGVISSLHGPVTLKMLFSGPGSTGRGLHFFLPLPFPCPLPPFLALPPKSPVKCRRPIILFLIFSSFPPVISLMPGVM